MDEPSYLPRESVSIKLITFAVIPVLEASTLTFDKVQHLELFCGEVRDSSIGNAFGSVRVAVLEGATHSCVSTIVVNNFSLFSFGFLCC